MAAWSNPITFDPTTGAYDQALPVANLAIGQHTIALSTQEPPATSTMLTRTVNVAALAAFTLSTVTPGNGETDVGVTYRPRIDFTRAVNPATLTSSSFFATDAAGNVVDATIAPAQDGSYAYLLFKTQLPGSSAITLHVVGTAIRAAADGAFLDAAGNGSRRRLDADLHVHDGQHDGRRRNGDQGDRGRSGSRPDADDVRRYRPRPGWNLNTPDDVY